MKLTIAEAKLQKTGPYEVYGLLTAIRVHYLSDSYDFFKYNGECRAICKYEIFSKRKDKYSFLKLGRVYNQQDMIYFLGVNLYENSNFSVHDMFYDEQNVRYKEWKSRQTDAARKHNLKEFLKNDIKQIITVQENKLPVLFEMMLGGQIHHDTVVLLDTSLKFTNEWLKAYPGDPVVIPLITKFNKFKRFVQNITIYDISTYENIIQEHMHG